MPTELEIANNLLIDITDMINGRLQGSGLDRDSCHALSLVVVSRVAAGCLVANAVHAQARGPKPIVQLLAESGQVLIKQALTVALEVCGPAGATIVEAPAASTSIRGEYDSDDTRCKATADQLSASILRDRLAHGADDGYAEVQAVAGFMIVDAIERIIKDAHGPREPDQAAVLRAMEQVSAFICEMLVKETCARFGFTADVTVTSDIQREMVH